MGLLSELYRGSFGEAPPLKLVKISFFTIMISFVNIKFNASDKPVRCIETQKNIKNIAATLFRVAATPYALAQYSVHLERRKNLADFVPMEAFGRYAGFPAYHFQSSIFGFRLFHQKPHHFFKL